MHIKKPFIYVACVVLMMLVLPFFVREHILLVLIPVCINVLLASSLRVSLNAGQINFGIAAYVAIGAYTSTLMTMKLGVPFLPAFLAAGITAAVASLLVGYATLRAKYVYFMILTFAFVEVVRVSAIKWSSLTGGVVGVMNIPPVSIAGIELVNRVPQYYFTVLVTGIILLILYRLENSRFGLTVKSLSQTEELGKAVGLNTYMYQMLAFAVSCFFAGLTGSLYAHVMSFIQPDIFGFMMCAMVMVYCFAGGVGGFAGPIVGAAVLSLLTEPLRGFMYFERIFYAVVMVLVVLFLPDGIISLPARLLSLVWGARKPREQQRAISSNEKR